MEKQITLPLFLVFFKKNWFKLALVVLGFYAWFKKDLTISVQVDDHPYRIEKSAQKSKEKYTDTAPLVASQPSKTDRLELPIIAEMSGRPAVASEFAAIDESVKLAYLERFAKVALAEQQRYGIPASVILAVAMYQSVAGQRDVALQVNNHFAMPCGGDRSGTCREFQGHAYRKYGSAWASFRDFSLFAKENFARLRGANYQAWVLALEESGFAETDHFAQNIIAIIEAYKLED
ncbi:MAG: glucosaminidase domain-containing protein [Bacteroidetes bacterium]|nr:glucosaminidase domain-containing protein [Bacteroidota bacterium]